MRRARVLGLAAGAVLLWSVGDRPVGVVTAQQGVSVVPAAADERALLDKYCVSCHNRRSKTAGLALDEADVAHVGADPQTWEKVVRKLRAGVMPPIGRPRPEPQTKDALVSRLEAALDTAAAAAPNPGRTETLHRLNRAEYRNAVRDLLALDVDVSSLLPPDDASYGFDNVAAVLRVSPTLMERYLTAAQKVAPLAMGSTIAPSGPLASSETYRVPSDMAQDRRVEGLPLGTRGGILIHRTFPQDGEYVFRVRLARDTMDNVPRYQEPHDLEVAIDGERAGIFTLEAELDSEDTLKRYKTEDRQLVDANWTARVPVSAGPHDVTAAFLEKTGALMDTTRVGGIRSDESLQLKQPFERGYLGGFINAEGRRQPYLSSVTILGPFNPSAGSDTPSRRRIFGCGPSGATDEAACARTSLSRLARRAYRRPVIDADLKPLLAFYEDGRKEGGFEAGIDLALRAMLTSPDFLFRIEHQPDGTRSGASYRVSAIDLASRLSFFLWSSSPDDELLDAAASGQLQKSAELERQVRRMLADPRAEQFVVNFAGQWLYLRNLPSVRPHPYLFPDFDESLRRSFRRETELFFASIMREDRSVIDFLDADYTFVDERLAAHYGIANVKGSDFRRITLADPNRRGLLGQGSILTVTSMANRTSSVLRGKWIMENLLGAAPPPPPPNVPGLAENSRGAKPRTVRERLVEHRKNPVCASCHAIMDPLGFSLENFDAVGRWRQVGESFEPIDATGGLPNGTQVSGPDQLREALLSQPDLFVEALTEKLFVYSLGRGLEYYDMPALRATTRAARTNNYRSAALILGVVTSDPFQMRRAQ